MRQMQDMREVMPCKGHNNGAVPNIRQKGMHRLLLLPRALPRTRDIPERHYLEKAANEGDAPEEKGRQIQKALKLQLLPAFVKIAAYQQFFRKNLRKLYEEYLRFHNKAYKCGNYFLHYDKLQRKTGRTVLPGPNEKIRGKGTEQENKDGHENNDE